MEQNGSGTLLYPLGLEQCLALSTCLVNCTGWMNEETLNSSDRQRARGRGANNQNQKLSNRDSRWTVDVTKTPQRKWGFKGARKYDENEALIPCGTARGEHTKGVGCMQSISQVTWLLLTSALHTIRDTCYSRWRTKAEPFSTTFIPEIIEVLELLQLPYQCGRDVCLKSKPR